MTAASGGDKNDGDDVRTRVRPLPAWLRPAMAVLLVVLSFGCFAALLLYSEDKENLIMLMFGFVSGSCLAPVVQYVFGSSQSDADKDSGSEKMLQKLTK